jgi:hypothetical protein
MVAQKAWGNHLIFFSQRKKDFLKYIRWSILFTSRVDEDSKTQKRIIMPPNTIYTPMPIK